MADKWKAVRGLGKREYIITDENNLGLANFGENKNAAYKAAAAPDMYEALKEWSALEEAVKECETCCEKDSVCGTHYYQAKSIQEMRDKALLKAKGREV